MWPLRDFVQNLEKTKIVKKIPKKRFLDDGAFPIVSQEAGLVNGYWNEVEDVFKVNKPVVIFGDHTTLVKYVDFDFVQGADGVKVLQPKEDLDAKFLYYFILANPLKSLGYARHYRLLKELKVPLAPVEEQKRIVRILDEAFAGIDQAIANTEKNLQNARELFESYLNDIFSQKGEGWVTDELQNLVTDDCSLSYGIVQPGNEVVDGLPVVRPTDLGKKIIELNGLKLIDPIKADSYKKTTLQGNDLLLCVRGSTGAISFASSALKGANVTRGLVPIRFNSSKIIQEFGYFAFISRPIQSQIKAGTYGAALMQINIRDLKKTNFQYPNTEVQTELLKQLKSSQNSCDDLEINYKQKLTALKELKQSLLQKAFAGELTSDMRKVA